VETLVRSLNRLGMDRFRSYLSQQRAGANAPPPRDLLEDTAYTRELPVDISIDQREFGDRLTLGRYLAERLTSLDPETTDRDPGLWSWLALLYWDQVCPKRDDGSRHPGRDYRHIPEFGYRHRHRHLLFGPYQIYRRHRELSVLLLTGPIHTESSVYHEIASRQDFISNKGVLEAAALLYLDARRGRPKPGAQGSHRHPGTVRRFVHVLQQLDVTYDIYSLTGSQILELLPEEFDIWKRQQTMVIASLSERPADRADNNQQQPAP